MTTNSAVSETLNTVEEIASSGLTQGVDDFESFMMGVNDGIETGMVAASETDLVVTEVIGKVEAALQRDDKDYLRGAFLGALATPHLLKRLDEAGTQGEVHV